MAEGSNPPQTPYRPPFTSLPTSQWGFHTPGPCISAYPYSAASTPQAHVLPSMPTSTARKSTKRPLGKENTAPTISKRRKTRTLAPEEPAAEEISLFQKVQMFFGFLEHVLKLSYGELLYATSLEISDLAKNHNNGTAQPDPLLQNGIQVSPASKAHITSVMQNFLNGRGEYTPATILERWLKHAYGAGRDSDLMFSTHTPFTKIGPIRQALTSFAAQIVRDELVKEAEEAIRTTSGLHVSISTKKTSSRDIKWTDIGSTTVEYAQGIIKKHQPLAWKLVVEMASRAPRKENGVKLIRQKRPPELVATGVLSTINFSRSSRAKLLPLATGLLYFGSLASTDLYRYRSRMGEMPAYSSVVRAMRALSVHEAEVTLSHGLNPETVGVIRLDNVQNYLFQRDQAIGRENRLNIGLAATYYEVDGDDINPAHFDLSRKQSLLLKSPRRNLTVSQLQQMIDNRHIETICVLQWMNALIQNIPQLAHLKPGIALLYKTRAAKLRLPAKPAKVHPLASSSRNESNFTDLKDALNDFFEQTGHTPENFKERLFPVGGDGLTFEKMVQLKEYLQFHENEFESMGILQPMLEWWHTEWTNLSRIFECHWGSPFSKDPSTLGNSADKIGRKRPTNLKKIDYYTNLELAYLVLDARLIDCWRIYYKSEDLFDTFNVLHEQKKMSTLEDLEPAARELYRTYTSVRAQERAMMGDKMVPTLVPRGAPQEDSSTPPLPLQDNEKTKVKAASKAPPKFKGDQTLARSIAFIRETMLAREMTLATAAGDVGRLWEVIKTMVFSFAGSSHGKYTNYLLEMITDLELECDAELRTALLKISLVNLSGMEGRWSAGDFIQEYFNRLLEAIVQRKGVEYGDNFIRNVWARNVHHIGRLKLAWLEGVGLKRHSGKHTGAKQHAEMRILLAHYKDTQLHSICPGRKHDYELFEDDFQKGIRNLRGGRLRKWIDKTLWVRGLMTMAPDTPISGNESDSDDEDPTEPEASGEQSAGQRENLRFTTFTHDGALLLNPLDIDNDVEVLMDAAGLDGMDNLDLDSSDDDN